MNSNQKYGGFGVFLLEFKATTAIDFEHIYKIHLQSHGSGGKARWQSRATVPLKKLEKTSGGHCVGSDGQLPAHSLSIQLPE
jgi:hypothetical protein